MVTDKTQFVIGDEFSVDVKIDSENVGINAAQATVNFPVGVLQATTTSKASSVFTFWLQDPTIDNTAGKVSFIGGSMSGLDGKTLQALRITFKVVGSGPADISFADGAITASDGNGSNVLSAMKGLSVTSITKQSAALIIPPPVIPPVKVIKRVPVPTGKPPIKPVLSIPLYPVADGWYNDLSDFIVQWQLPADVIGVATSIDQRPTLATSTKSVSEGLFDNKTFPKISDGVWYVHVRFKNDLGWGPFSDYKIGIDTDPPLAFAVVVEEGLSTYVTAPTLEFQTNDQPSGIASYHILDDKKEIASVTALKYTLPSQTFGKHSITVVAEDKAGNKTSTSVDVTILEQAFVSIGIFSFTQFQFFGSIILILLMLFIAWWYSYKLWAKQLERRILIAERDVANTLNIISEDAEKIVTQTKENHINAKELNEMGFLAKKIDDKIKNAKKYIVDNIREIGQK
jgi:hypothetical protein